MRHTVARGAQVVAAGGCELVRASGPLFSFFIDDGCSCAETRVNFVLNFESSFSVTLTHVSARRSLMSRWSLFSPVFLPPQQKNYLRALLNIKVRFCKQTRDFSDGSEIANTSRVTENGSAFLSVRG